MVKYTDDKIISYGLVLGLGYLLYKSKGISSGLSETGSSIGNVASSVATNTSKVLDLVGNSATGTQNIIDKANNLLYEMGQSLKSSFKQREDDFFNKYAEEEKKHNDLYSKYEGLFEAEVNFLKSKGGYTSNEELDNFTYNYIKLIDNNNKSSSSSSKSSSSNSKSSSNLQFNKIKETPTITKLTLPATNLSSTLGIKTTSTVQNKFNKLVPSISSIIKKSII